MKATRRRLYVVTCLTDCCLGLLIFAVSRSMAEAGADLFQLGLAGGGLSLVWASSSLVCGRLSDRIGRRGLILAGALTLFAGSAGCALLHRSLGLRLLFYCLGGLAGGMIYPPLIAWLSRGQGGIAGGRRRASRTLIHFCLAWNVGLVTGQLSGGALFAVDPQFPLLLAAVLSLVSLGVMLRTEPGSVLPPEGEPDLGATERADQARSAVFALVGWIANLGGAFSVGVVLHLFPDLAVGLGVAPERHGLMLAAMRAVTIGTYVLMHRSSFWHHRFGVSLVAQGVGVLGLAVLIVARTQAGLTLGLCGVGLLLGFNYFASLYYSTTSRGEQGKGLATGMHEMTLGLGIAAGSFVGGLAGNLFSARAPYQFSALVLIVLVFVQCYVVRRRNGSAGRP